MKIQRTLPPAAAPIYLRDIFNGIRGIIRGKTERERFRNELKDHFNVKYCFLVSSGKAALYCILKALHEIHPDKDEVLVPAFNCYSVPSAIVYAGLKTRLCDVNPDTLDFDFPALAREFENLGNLLCVVPTHLFGIPADVARVNSMSKDRVIVVEDAAQAFGSSKAGKNLGLSGDVGFFSLGRGKAFSTYEGGIIVTNSDVIGRQLATIVEALPEYSLFQELRLLLIAKVLAFFSHPLLFWLPKGLPFLGIGETVFERSFPIRKLSPFQAGLTKGWKEKINRMISGRKTMTGYWKSFFQSNPVLGILPIAGASDMPDGLLRFPVRIDNKDQRDRIVKKSEEQGLGISATYPESLHKLPEIAGQITGEYPQAAQCARSLITLPVHCYVNKKDIEKIKKVVSGQ
jgi:perosamine synthetase